MHGKTPVAWLVTQGEVGVGEKITDYVDKARGLQNVDVSTKKCTISPIFELAFLFLNK